MVAALLWDNDGVLVETEALYFRATRELLAEAGVDLSRERYREVSLRQGRSCFDLALDAGADPGRVERLKLRRNDRYMELLAAGVSVRPGIRECLEALRGRMPMAIVTSSRLDHFETVHRRTGLLRYFDFALGPDDYGRHKPHPEPYLTAAARLGVAPERCLAVEDTERGLHSAVAAGMRCLVFPHELTFGGDFSTAWRVVREAAEIPPAVAELAAGARTGGEPPPPPGDTPPPAGLSG